MILTAHSGCHEIGQKCDNVCRFQDKTVHFSFVLGRVAQLVQVTHRVKVSSGGTVDVRVEASFRENSGLQRLFEDIISQGTKQKFFPAHLSNKRKKAICEVRPEDESKSER
jgi:hypothetical protein